MPNDKLLKELLLQNIEKLQVALVSYEISFEKCKRIDLNKPLSFEESETFDSLSSKFGRISDIYTQKVLRTIFVLIRENAMHIVDLANKAEKLELIENADLLISVRDLRNQITHEYEDENLVNMYSEIFRLSEPLIRDMNMTFGWVDRYLIRNPDHRNPSV